MKKLRDPLFWVSAFSVFLSLLAVGIVLVMIVGCAGTLEETRGAVSVRKLAGVQVARVSERCESLSGKERIWTGVAVGGAFLAGASGLAMFPATTDTQKQILSAATIGAGVGAAVGVVEQQSYARAWQSEGCGQ